MSIKELHNPIQAGALVAPKDNVQPDKLTGGPFGVIGAGPVALAMKYFFEIQSLYLKLMDMFKEMGLSELTVASTTALSTADAVEKSALHQSLSTYMQAGGMMAQGTAGLAANLAPNENYNTGVKKLEAAQAEQEPLQALDKTMVETPDGESVMGPGVRKTLSADAEARQTELLKGNYKMTKGTKEEQELVDKDVIQNSPELVAKLKAALPAKLQEAASNVNTAQLQVNKAVEMRQSFGQAAGNMLNAAGQAVSGGFQYLKGKEDAIAEIAKTTQGMAANAVSTANKQQNDDANKSADEIRQLQALRDGSRVNS